MTDTCNGAKNSNSQSQSAAVAGALSLAETARAARSKVQQASTATAATTTAGKQADKQTNEEWIISRGTESPTTVVTMKLPTTAQTQTTNQAVAPCVSKLAANLSDPHNDSLLLQAQVLAATSTVNHTVRRVERESKAARREQIWKEYPGLTSSHVNEDHDPNGQQRTRGLVPSGMQDTEKLLRRIQSARALLPAKKITEKATECDAHNNRPKRGAVGGRAKSCRHLSLRPEHKKMVVADSVQEEEEEEDDEEQEDLADTEDKPDDGAGKSPRARANVKTSTRRHRASPEEHGGKDHTISTEKAKTTPRHSTSVHHTKKQVEDLVAATSCSQREADIISPTTEKIRTSRTTSSAQQHNNQAEDSALDNTAEKQHEGGNLSSPTAKGRTTRTRRKISLEDKRQLPSTPTSTEASRRVRTARRPSLQHQQQGEEEGNGMGSPLSKSMPTGSSTNTNSCRRRSDAIGAAARGRRKGQASRGVRLTQIQQCLQADSDVKDDNQNESKDEDEGKEEDPQDVNDQQELYLNEERQDPGAGQDTDKEENKSPKTSPGNPLSKFAPLLSFGQKKHWDALE